MTQLPANTPQQTGADGDSDLIDLGALMATIWRGKWLILLTTILAIIAAGYYAFNVAVPLYRSTSVVIFETQQEAVVDLQSVVSGFSGDTTAVNSEVEVLRSRSLMGKVVERLDLTADPEFNDNLKSPSLVDQAIGWAKTRAGLATTMPDLPAEVVARQEHDSAVNALLDRVRVQNVSNSLVFQITAETENAEKSALIADTIVELYILNQLEVKFEATEQATTWLTNRVAELQVQLEDAEAQVADFNATTDLVSIEALQALERQLKDLRDRTSDAEAATAAATAKLTALQAAETIDDKVQRADDPQLERLAQDPADRAAFDARFDQVVARAQIDVDRNQQQLAALLAAAPQLETNIADQSQDLIALQQLRREAEANRLLYEYFLSRLKETSAQEGIQRADSRILSNAVIANSAASPRKPLILVMATILGMLIGIALVLLREARSTGFRTARDLEAATGQNVLGQIPLIPARSRRKILRYFSEKPTSAAVEAYRNLRTSILLSDVDNPPQVIISTSSIPGEGKTTNSLALAHNLVGMGKKVLLVEGDIRRRTLNQYFENVPAKGLVSVLAGEASFDDVVFQDKALGADLIAGEKTNSNAADLFSSKAFAKFVADARAAYDIVIIDTPPVLVVPDARIIAQNADAIVFSVKWDSTSRAQVDESMRLFRDARLKLSGLVLSQISPRGMKAYGYGGKYGAYAGYDSKYYTN